MTWHYFIGLSRIKTVDSAQETEEEHPLNSYELLTECHIVRDCC